MRDVNKLTFIEHLTELRRRLFIILVAVLLCSCICYRYIHPIVEKVIDLVEDKVQFIYISPPELFLAYIKISLVAGIVLSSPIIFYEIWVFIKPGLEKKERRYVFISLFGGAFFFVLGVVFCFKIVLPVILYFFVNLRMEEIQPMMSVGNYMSFISTTLLSFGIIFEMPMIVLILSRLGLVTSDFLKKNRKYIIFIIFVVAAIITPPDVISQLLLACPMLILYEVSILFARIIERKWKKQVVQVN